MSIISPLRRRPQGCGSLRARWQGAQGELKTKFDPDKVDLEEIKSYCKAFPVYLRKDEKGLGRRDEGDEHRLGSGRRHRVMLAIGTIINGVQFRSSGRRAI